MHLFVASQPYIWARLRFDIMQRWEFLSRAPLFAINILRSRAYNNFIHNVNIALDLPQSTMVAINNRRRATSRRPNFLASVKSAFKIEAIQYEISKENFGSGEFFLQGEKKSSKLYCQELFFKLYRMGRRTLEMLLSWVAPNFFWRTVASHADYDWLVAISSIEEINEDGLLLFRAIARCGPVLQSIVLRMPSQKVRRKKLSARQKALTGN